MTEPTCLHPARQPQDDMVIPPGPSTSVSAPLNTAGLPIPDSPSTTNADGPRPSPARKAWSGAVSLHARPAPALGPPGMRHLPQVSHPADPRVDGPRRHHPIQPGSLSTGGWGVRGVLYRTFHNRGIR